MTSLTYRQVFDGFKVSYATLHLERDETLPLGERYLVSDLTWREYIVPGCRELLDLRRMLEADQDWALFVAQAWNQAEIEDAVEESAR